MENHDLEQGDSAAQKLFWHEVSPRDGLQNETTLLGLPQKLELLRLLVAAGPDSIEVTSFVRPDRVPQLADASQLCEQLHQEGWFQQARISGMRFTGLVANRRGLDRLLAANLDSVTLLVSATDAHSQANVGMSRAAASAEMGHLIQAAKSAGLQIRAYVSMAFVCPFEGTVDPAPVLDLMAQFYQQGADVIIPADTLGAAQPSAIAELLEAVKGTVPAHLLGMHLHNTQGRALENCQVAWQAGIRHFDAAAGGTGGCPFAPGAAGNLDSSELLKWASRHDYSNQADPAELDAAAAYLAGKLTSSAS